MSSHAELDSARVLDDAGRIVADLYCTQCGASMRSQPVTNMCATCQQPLAHSMAGLIPQIDDDGRIAEDVFCVSCGYNLRMQLLSGICPECATPVARSPFGYYLRHASHDWVTRISRGATQILIGFAWVIATYVVSIIGGMLAGPASNFTGAGVVGIIFGVVAAWQFLAGLWRLTTRDPADRHRPEGLTARRVVRFCLIASPALVLLTVLFQSLVMRVGVFAPAFWLFVMIIPLSMMIAAIALPAAVYRHLAALMRRVPRPGLVTFAKIEFWGSLICGGGVACGQAFMMWALWSTAPTWAAGPGTPYAMGPNTPMPTTSPARASPGQMKTLTALGYVSPPPTASAPSSSPTTAAGRGVATYTITTPYGNTVTTTMPATMPATVGTGPPGGPLFWIATATVSISGCAGIPLSIGGLVLLFMVQRALSACARRT